MSIETELALLKYRRTKIVATLGPASSEEELIERVTLVLEGLQSTFTRTSKGKVALLDLLAAYESPRIAEAAIPSLEDPNDDVSVAALRCLSKPSYESQAREAFLSLFVAAEDRPRVQTRVLESLSEQGWPVSGFRRRIEDKLPEGFLLTREGLVTHRR